MSIIHTPPNKHLHLPLHVMSAESADPRSWAGISFWMCVYSAMHMSLYLLARQCCSQIHLIPQSMFCFLSPSYLFPMWRDNNNAPLPQEQSHLNTSHSHQYSQVHTDCIDVKTQIAEIFLSVSAASTLCSIWLSTNSQGSRIWQFFFSSSSRRLAWYTTTFS